MSNRTFSFCMAMGMSFYSMTAGDYDAAVTMLAAVLVILATTPDKTK